MEFPFFILFDAFQMPYRMHITSTIPDNADGTDLILMSQVTFLLPEASCELQF